jgi:thioredoxin reductase/NAD-dependent dihydropyrimidine dehydrogenase PreA subunit
MPSLLSRYARWLHLDWPAGRVEPLPVTDGDGRTNVPGLYVCGDLRGIPLLKFALDSGVRAMRAIHLQLGRGGGGGRDPGNAAERAPDVLILGAGVSGMAAALEARRLGIGFEVLEASEPFSTLVNFPRAKPIFTYPAGMIPEGSLQVSASVKEPLVEELRAQVLVAGIAVTPGRAERVERRGGELLVSLNDGRTRRARAVLVAIGRSGDFRRLGVPGEDSGKVFNRLHDPADFRGRDVLVVGGGDTGLEAAVALADAGARTTLSCRAPRLVRAKPVNVAAVEERVASGALELKLGTVVREVREGEVVLATATRAAAGPASADAGAASVPGAASVDATAGPSPGVTTLRNDVVFAMVGREAPLAFLRRSGVRLAGEHTRRGTVALAVSLVVLALLLDWKAAGFLDWALWSRWGWPGDSPGLVASLGGWWAAQVADRSTVVGTLAVSMQGRAFYYTILYTLIVGWFGVGRVRRRPTPYVARQTLTLVLIQAFPLFLLPELLLPWLGYNGAFDAGAGRAVADALFEPTIPAADLAAGNWPAWGHPRSYWRAYGFILAWPLNVYNVFTHQPLWAWIAIGSLQTLVLIPLAVLRWGKGAYCGWVCSCGALAETLGDAHRGRMPHGPGWNRLNLVGQVFLAAALALLALRVAAWAAPATGLGAAFDLLAEGRTPGGALLNPLSYKWLVDVFCGGVLGLGLYFRYSGRVWCRFACPLAAFMNVVARFSRFAIVPEKPKCISCNACTSVCHQGIDVMAFANRGLPMRDPQCVRCSACVHDCPTGVLSFGTVARDGTVVSLDSLRATPARPRAEAPASVDTTPQA